MDERCSVLLEPTLSNGSTNALYTVGGKPWLRRQEGLSGLAENQEINDGTYTTIRGGTRWAQSGTMGPAK